MWDVRAMSLEPLIEVSLSCLGRNPVNCVTWANIIIPLSMQPARVMAVVTEPAIGLTKLALMLFLLPAFITPLCYETRHLRRVGSHCAAIHGALLPLPVPGYDGHDGHK